MWDLQKLGHYERIYVRMLELSIATPCIYST